MTRLGTAAVIFCFVGASASLVNAQSSIVRIEEDWEMHVQQPDALRDAPQATATMVPFGVESALVLQVDLNHASVPTFSSGGLQLRVSMDSDSVQQLRLLDGERLEYEAEVVRWTQFVQLTSGGFSFGISQGSSASWGNMGGPASVIHLQQADIGSALVLERYDPANSLKHSGVNYARNRVSAFLLKRVRLYYSTGVVVGVDVQ